MYKKLPTRVCDLAVVAILVFFFVGLAEFGTGLNVCGTRIISDDQTEQLGAENDSIAISIVSGSGFSDPFGEPTGPTAWMPPVLPYFLALMYQISGGNRQFVINAIVFLQAISMVLVGWWVVGQSRRLCRPVCGYICFVVACCVDFYWCFQTASDVWVNTFITMVLFYGFLFILSRPLRFIKSFAWGLVGGAIALCSPVYGAVWALLTLYLGLRHTLLTTALFHIGVSSLVSILVVSPWTIRNYYTFGRIIPIKSNLGFELWQSQCLDSDGLLDSITLNDHPWSSAGNTLRHNYKSQGESEFLKEKYSEAILSISSNPKEYLKRVFRRFLAITVFPQVENTAMGNFARFAFCAPFFSLVFVSVFRRKWSVDLEVVTILYVSIHIPFMLLSYYGRYSAPTLGLKAILVLFAIETVAKSRFLPSVRGKLGTK